MRHRKCEICGMRTERKGSIKRFFMARFPTDEDRCKLWVKVTGNEDLAYIPIEKLHDLKFVCGKHFKEKDFKKKKTQLKKTAVPSLNLSSTPLSDDVLTGFPCRLYKEQFVQEVGHTVHNFPNPTKFPERFRTWVEVVGSEQLRNLSNEDIYPRMKVCDKHFKDCHRNRNNRLNAVAIPSLHLPENKCEKEIRHVDHAYVKPLPRSANIADSTKIIYSSGPGPASGTTAEYEFRRPSTKLLPQDLEIGQYEAMDSDDFHDAPLSPEDYTPTYGSSSHDEHHGTSLIEDQQTVQNNQSTGTAPQDSTTLDDDPILDLGIDDSVSELLNIASEHPALKKIEVDEESIGRVERDQCAALYMELLERICDAFDRIPRFVKEKLPGYDEKVYAQMVQLKIKLKIVIKPLVQECVRVDDPLAMEEHCSDVSKLYGDNTCDAESQDAEKSNFAQSATYNQSTECVEDDQEIVEIEYLEDILETDEILSLQENRSKYKHKDIHKKEYLEDKLSKNPENTAYKVRTHPSSRVYSGNLNRNLEPYVLLEDCHQSRNTLHDTALNRNLRGKPTRFIMEDNHPKSSYLSSTAESPHKYKVKMKLNNVSLKKLIG